MWRSDEEKVRKLLESIAMEAGKRRLRHVQRLVKMGSDEISTLANAAPVLIHIIEDPDEEVWSEAKDLFKLIVNRKPHYLMSAVGGLVPYLRMGGTGRKRALELAKMISDRKREYIKDLVPVLLTTLEIGNAEERSMASGILKRLGIKAKEYITRLRATEGVIESAKKLGADTQEAERIFEVAKRLMVDGNFEEFLMKAKKAELVARYAKKTSILWKDSVKGISAMTMSGDGRRIGVASGSELLMYQNDKEILWRVTLVGKITVLEFGSDDRSIYAGTDHNTIYYVSRTGEITWRKKRGGGLLALELTKTNLVYVASTDSNVSILSIDGVEINRYWTEKPVKNLTVSDDGKNVVIIYGDHNLFCYDQEIFQRWKFMGGIWNDIATSGDGNFIIGGSLGGDMVCLNKTGIPLWKMSGDEPVNAVAVNTESNFVLWSVGPELFCSNNVGKIVWKLTGKKTIRRINVSGSAELIAVSTGDDIILIENREAYRNFLGSLPLLLRSMDSFGIDISGVEEGLNEAKRSFEENDFRRGTEHVEEIKKTIEEAKLERASEMLVLVEKEVSDAKSHGIDVSRCEDMMRDAEERIMDGDMDGAIQTARMALEEARVAETAKKRLEKAERAKKQEKMKQIINLAIAMVDEAVEYGIDRKEAEDILHAMIAASDEGEFDQCIFLVRELEELIDKEKGMVPGRTEANYGKVVSITARDTVNANEAEEVHDMISKAVKFYEKSGNLKRVGECYELLGKMEAKRNNPVYSRSLYQKAINTYFKSGDLEKIAKIIMAMMKELGEEEVPFYEIEDIFLIYRDGRLVSHQTMRLRPDMDNQILGGMLIAIQNFVEDGLVGKKQAGGLNELVYGRTRILIERGKYITLALVISGKETRDLWTKMKKTIVDVEEKYEKILDKWDGDLDKLWGARKMLEDFADKI